MHIEGLLGVIHPIPAAAPTLARAHQLDVSKHAPKLPPHVHQHVQSLLIQEVLSGKHPGALSAILHSGCD